MRNVDFEQFKRLVHYICSVADQDQLGAIKLNKILWFADAMAFARDGQSITAATYMKQKFGPVPRPMVPAMDALEKEGKLQ